MIAESEVGRGESLLTPLESLVTYSENLVSSSSNVTVVTPHETAVVLFADAQQPKQREEMCQTASIAAVPAASENRRELNSMTHTDTGLIEFANVQSGRCSASKTSKTTSVSKKAWTKRPESWISIAEEAELNGNHASLQKFKSEFEGMSDFAAYRRLYKWKKDIKNHKPPSYSTRIPSYGKVIDDNLLKDFQGARSKGILVGDELLRQYLMVHLAKANLNTLLIENGGKHTFGASWASRFCKRHNVGSRRKLKSLATTSTEDERENEKLNNDFNELKRKDDNDVSVNRECSTADLTSSDTDSDSDIQNSRKKMKTNFQ